MPTATMEGLQERLEEHAKCMWYLHSILFLHFVEMLCLWLCCVVFETMLALIPAKYYIPQPEDADGPVRAVVIFFLNVIYLQ